MRQIQLIIITIIMLTGCEDKAMVNIYKPAIKDKKIECLKLSISPPSNSIEQTMNTLYHFDNSCSLTLEVSYKNGIVCNSNQNVDKKALTAFPKSYLRMELREGFTLQYSYYKDLNSDIDTKELIKAFERIEEDLKL